MHFKFDGKWTQRSSAGFIVQKFYPFLFLNAAKSLSISTAVQRQLNYPGWKCSNFLHVFVGYQAMFP